MYNEIDIENTPSNVYVPWLIKSIGEEDADGNYIFEVEASNENLDLQNQRIQQKALLGSEDFFISNGVISDDHQHKRYDKDGNVISDKTKIIGEPISVRTEGTSTFVKGKLYGAVEAAKPFIKLLKAHSSRVKASVGGIMPRIIKNSDGTETVTAFRWNDLALTTSPVNYTVGSAVFAKSVSNLDFCKALSAGYGTDSATMTGGRALQKEDLEKKITEVIPELTENEEKESEDIEIINELMASIGTGEIKTKINMEKFLIERGFSKEKARATVREIISQGGHTNMAKSIFGQVRNILKSFGGENSPENADEKDKFKKPDEKDLPPVGGNEDGSEEIDIDEEDEIEEKSCVEKSLPDGYSDATEILGNILSELKKSSETMDALSKRMDDYEAQQEDVTKSILEVAKEFGDFANSPLPKKSATSIAKSEASGNTVSGKFTEEDWTLAKSAIISAVKANEITLEKSELLSSACQKALHGAAMSRDVWNEMSVLCRKYASN